MERTTNTRNETFFQVIIGIVVAVLAIFVIKSLFEHDNSKILSKKGSQMLSDDEKMKELDRKLREMEDSKESEIII